MDIISLEPDERTAALLLLTGSSSPEVSDAVTAAVRRVLLRTRV